MVAKLTLGTYFSGGGIFEAMLKDIADIRFAVEYDKDICQVYANNHSITPINDMVQNINPKSLPYVDWFHSSPPCVEFSKANVGGVETEKEISETQASLNYIRTHKPQFVSFENVRGWGKSGSFQAVCLTLADLYYGYKFAVLNAADYGVPQTRERLILVASRIGIVKLPEPTHHNGPELPQLWGSPIRSWVGWYEAIEDLIPELPDSQFADWQLKRLPKDLRETILVGTDTANTGVSVLQRSANEPANTIKASAASHLPKALLIDSKNAGQEWGKLYRDGNEPSITITSGLSGHLPKAYLVDVSNPSRESTVRGDEEPSYTVTGTAMRRPVNYPKAYIVSAVDATVRQSDEPSTTIVGVGDGHSVGPRAFIISAADKTVRQEDEPIVRGGRVVKMSPRALARFQSIPDSYILPDKDNIACKIVGNGVPSLLARAVGLEIQKVWLLEQSRRVGRA